MFHTKTLADRSEKEGKHERLCFITGNLGSTPLNRTPTVFDLAHLTLTDEHHRLEIHLKSLPTQETRHLHPLPHPCHWRTEITVHLTVRSHPQR